MRRVPVKRKKAIGALRSRRSWAKLGSSQLGRPRREVELLSSFAERDLEERLRVFLGKVLADMPFEVKVIQFDGGSECEARSIDF